MWLISLTVVPHPGGAPKPGFHPALPDGLEFLPSLRNVSACVGNGQPAGSGVVFHPRCWGQVYSLPLQTLLATLSRPALCPVFQSLLGSTRLLAFCWV